MIETRWCYLGYICILLGQCSSLTAELRGNGASVTGTSTTEKPSVKGQAKGGSCYKGDLVCEKDKLGYEAIVTLHHQMDDDENGDIDLEESAEFLMEELQYQSSHWSEHRSKSFHMNDTHITVDDLWNIWKNSSVHNWTIEQVVTWLAYEVELPQYSETFKMNAVDGSTLPRLAVNNLNFVSNILGIKNLVHKQKLANKATDVVLFGPPKSRHNWYKDVALVTSIAVAAVGCWFAYRQNKQLEINMARTMRDMDSLAKSEEALKQLQERLETEELEKRLHIQHKEQLEKRVQYEISEAKLEAQKEQTETQLTHMKETLAELERTKQALLMAEKELEVRSSLAPSIELQRWLQITYELELKAYNEKKSKAEQQLHNAKDSCERLRRKRQAIFGSIRMANSGSIDETENIIITAKNALEEVKHDLAERQYRWQQVENMCNFSIISNPGIKGLIHGTGHTDLYRFCHGGALLETAGSTDLDDFDDIPPPTYCAAVAAMQCNGHSRQRSRDSLTAQSKVGACVRTVPSSSKGVGSPTPINKHIFTNVPASSTGPPSTSGSLSRAGSEEPTVGPVLSSEDQSLVDDATQPSFGLYPDDHESSSTSSNENSSIPSHSHPRLKRLQPVCQQTDNMSVTSEHSGRKSTGNVSNDLLRSRTYTNESLAKYRPHRAHTVNSPLAASSGLSTSEIVFSNGSTTMKRSHTTDLQTLQTKNAVKLSTSAQCLLSQPESAPAYLMSTRDDSDTSTGSKDSLVNDRRKVNKKERLLSFLKRKPRPTQC